MDGDRDGVNPAGLNSENGLSATVKVTLLAAIAALAGWTFLVKRASSTPGRNLPPGPWSVPVLGSLPFLGMWDKDVHLAMVRLGKKYGDIFHFWIGNM